MKAAHAAVAMAILAAGMPAEALTAREIELVSLDD